MCGPQSLRGSYGDNTIRERTYGSHRFTTTLVLRDLDLATGCGLWAPFFDDRSSDRRDPLRVRLYS